MLKYVFKWQARSAGLREGEYQTLSKDLFIQSHFL